MPTSHVPDLVAHFDALASTLEPPAGVSSTTTPTPIAWDLDDRYLEDIRAVTATHSTALQDLGSDLNILSNAFRQFRGETAHVSSDLHTLSDQFLQFTTILLPRK